MVVIDVEEERSGGRNLWWLISVKGDGLIVNRCERIEVRLCLVGVGNGEREGEGWGGSGRIDGGGVRWMVG